MTLTVELKKSTMVSNSMNKIYCLVHTYLKMT
nr:MAG TPA: hypothetical protein [Bacteriophage sp.]